MINDRNKYNNHWAVDEFAYGFPSSLYSRATSFIIFSCCELVFCSAGAVSRTQASDDHTQVKGYLNNMVVVVLVFPHFELPRRTHFHN